MKPDFYGLSTFRISLVDDGSCPTPVHRVVRVSRIEVGPGGQKRNRRTSYSGSMFNNNPFLLPENGLSGPKVRLETVNG